MVQQHTLVKKAQQRLYFLRSLRKINISQQHLVSFYCCTVECPDLRDLCVVLLCGCEEGSTESRQLSPEDHQHPAPCHPGPLHLPLPEKSHQHHHPGHHLFALLPSGRRYRTVKTHTTRLLNSFYPRAITVLNTALKNSSHAL